MQPVQSCSHRSQGTARRLLRDASGQHEVNPQSVRRPRKRRANGHPAGADLLSARRSGSCRNPAFISCCCFPNRFRVIVSAKVILRIALIAGICSRTVLKGTSLQTILPTSFAFYFSWNPGAGIGYQSLTAKSSRGSRNPLQRSAGR